MLCEESPPKGHQLAATGLEDAKPLRWSPMRACCTGSLCTALLRPSKMAGLAGRLRRDGPARALRDDEEAADDVVVNARADLAGRAATSPVVACGMRCKGMAVSEQGERRGSSDGGMMIDRCHQRFVRGSSFKSQRRAFLAFRLCSLKSAISMKGRPWQRQTFTTAQESWQDSAVTIDRLACFAESGPDKLLVGGALFT